MIENGQLGKAHLIKSATNDQYDPSGFFVSYAAASGGIYIDCGIHDIDCARWLLDASLGIPNPKKQVRRVFAAGHNIRHPELVQDNDVDNAVGFVEFENGKMLVLHLSRTSMHGHDCFAEVFGTDGKVIVNGVSCHRLIRMRWRLTRCCRTLSLTEWRFAMFTVSVASRRE